MSENQHIKIRCEDWKDQRHWVKRDNKGRFLKGNFHLPDYWVNKVAKAHMGKKVSKEIKERISNSLKGLEFTEKRKRNISIGTRKAFLKYSKVCLHGIVPSYKCKECNTQYRKYLIRKGELNE